MSQRRERESRCEKILTQMVRGWKNNFISRCAVHGSFGPFEHRAINTLRTLCMTGHNIKYHQNKRSTKWKSWNGGRPAAPTLILASDECMTALVPQRRKFLEKNFLCLGAAKRKICGIKTCPGPMIMYAAGVWGRNVTEKWNSLHESDVSCTAT